MNLNPAPIDLLIFDLDGTLIDSRQDIANCVNWTLERLGLEPIDSEMVFQFVGHGVRELLEGTVKAAHGEVGFAEAMKVFDQFYLDHLLDETQLYPGMAEVLEYYRDKKLAIVTNKPQHYTAPIVRGLKLDQRCQLILGREATPERKPHPQPLLKVLSELQVPPERTVMIGDTEVDMQAGKAAQTQTCGVSYGFGKPELILAEKPDYMIDQAIELKGLFL